MIDRIKCEAEHVQFDRRQRSIDMLAPPFRTFVIGLRKLVDSCGFVSKTLPQ